MSDALPRFYRHWLGDLLPAPPEVDPVNCLNCHMVRPRGLTRDLGPFKASLKCCTFQPYLPAFTIGALLQIAQTESADVKSRALAFSLDRLLSGSRLTLLGAAPRKGATSVCETGKHVEDACPFLSKDENSVCTIRDYRPSTCAGYVCRSTRGLSGLKKWSEWEVEVSKFEATVVHLSAFELGYTIEEMDVEFSSVQAAREYYLASFERASQLTSAELS